LTRLRLEQDPELSVVGEAADGEAAIDGVRDACPDVVILDLGMPKLDGLEAIPRLREVAPDAQVVVFSGCGDDPRRAQARDLGATVVDKGDPFAVLVRAVHDSVGRAQETNAA
jgi:DNA-binding NarL/FixJ family response regulator